MISEFVEKTLLIVVRTYPVPAQRGVEVSCTAGITQDGQWIRIFPVPYRLLDQDKRFRKYQWIKVLARKAKDNRPESYEIRPESIEILREPLPPQNDWAERKHQIFPHLEPSLCSLRQKRDNDGFPTLGIFRPGQIERLLITPDEATWSDKQRQILQQPDLFTEQPKTQLEKVPFRFQYKFRCRDETCHGHTIICTDWELGQSWRKWSREYGARWETKFRQRYETEMIHKNETHFFVGTLRGHPHTWIIVGLFYPRNINKRGHRPLPLFDGAEKPTDGLD